MCSMALLHSRVKEVIYLLPMPRTGGCGGAANLPALPGVNHRYGILKWRLDEEWTRRVVGEEKMRKLRAVEESLDA
jgi:tRNA-specific adenosine deaminase 3